MRLALIVSLTTAALFLGGSADAVSSTGIGGVLYRGPITPVCRVGTPCDAPAPGVTLVFTRAGQTFRVRTGAGGHFAVSLRPGSYAVRVAAATTIGRGLSPGTIIVPRSGWARVRLMLDTGIR